MENWRSWRSKVGEIVGIWRTSMYIISTSKPLRENILNQSGQTTQTQSHILLLRISSKANLKETLKMSSLTYVNEPGAGQKHSDLGHYSQAVVIGNVAKLSGQGGWDNDGNLDQYDWKEQIKNAFDNVDRVLQAAGFRGWEDVSKAIVWSYLNLSDEVIGISPPQLPARYRQSVEISC